MRFGFLLNEVLTGLRRNVTMTVAMILTTAISIGLFGGGLLVVRLADNSRNIYLDRVPVGGFGGIVHVPPVDGEPPAPEPERPARHAGEPDEGDEESGE